MAGRRPAALASRERAGQHAGCPRSLAGCALSWIKARPPGAGREDQRWTLERVTTLIGRLFGVRYTLRGTSYLLHRIGSPPQVPVHRAAERERKRSRHRGT